MKVGNYEVIAETAVFGWEQTYSIDYVHLDSLSGGRDFVAGNLSYDKAVRLAAELAHGRKEAKR